MKRFLISFAILMTVLSLCLSFSSCLNGKTAFERTIQFEERYIYKPKGGVYSLTFFKDGTGEYEAYQEDSASKVISGTVRFEWRVASDNKVYLFKQETVYHKEHTAGEDYSINCTSRPLVFEKDFVSYTNDNSMGSYEVRYIREHSALWEE